MANTVILNAIKDTYVSANHPNSNFATSYGLKVTGDDNNGVWPIFASLVGFDLSSIPANKVITNMSVRVYLMGITNTAGNPVYQAEYQYWTMIMRARRVQDYSVSEIDTLTYSTVMAKPGINNPYNATHDSADSSINIAPYGNSYLALDVKDVTKSNECIVALFCDTDYHHRAIWNFGSVEHGESYIPRLLVTYDDYVPPKPSNLSPNSTVRNKAGEIKLAWQWEDAIMGTTQAGYELIYSTNGFTTSTTLTGTTDKQRAIPANTFTDGITVQWKVRITDTNGDTSSYSDISSFTIGVTTPSAPEPIGPTNTIANSSDIIKFRWAFKDLYGYAQAKYDLQYKKGSATEITVSNTSANNYYEMPPSILEGGDYLWRVRCYNAFNEVGTYSAWVPFYSIGQPATPVIISASNSMHPVVKWSANEQDLFIIRIYRVSEVIYNSGEMAGAYINEYTVDAFIDDGSYTIGIMTSNVYGFWSKEALRTFTVSTVKPTRPALSGSVNGLYIALIINYYTPDNIIYVQRAKEDHFKQLTALTQSNNTYVDYSTPVGPTKYYVRAVSATAFVDSEVITLDMEFDGVVLAGADNQSDYINLYKTKDVDKRKSISLSKDQFLVNCNGREYPLQQSTQFKSHIESHEYFIGFEDFDKFYRISEYETLLYRNNYGYSYIVTMSNRVIKEDVFGYIVAFTLTRLEE